MTKCPTDNDSIFWLLVSLNLQEHKRFDLSNCISLIDKKIGGVLMEKICSRYAQLPVHCCRVVRLRRIYERWYLSGPNMTHIPTATRNL